MTDEAVGKLLAEAIDTIRDLVDQQAMPDDWWADPLDRLERALAEVASR